MTKTELSEGLALLTKLGLRTPIKTVMKRDEFDKALSPSRRWPWPHNVTQAASAKLGPVYFATEVNMGAIRRSNCGPRDGKIITRVISLAVTDSMT